MKTNSKWMVLASGLTLALIAIGSAVADAQDYAQPVPRARSTNRVTTRSTTPVTAQQLGPAVQTPGLTVPLPDLAPQASGTAGQLPGLAPQLPGLATDPANPPGEAPAGVRPSVSTSINPAVPRPVAPTAGAALFPTPTSNASSTGYLPGIGSPHGATPTITPGAGYNSAATTAYGYMPSGPMIPLPPTDPGTSSLPAVAPVGMPGTLPAPIVGPMAPAPGTGAPIVSGPATIQAASPQAPVASAEKPFSNYTPPPVYSPYMNLFRNDTNQGRINNYYSRVRPILEQQNFNAQTQNRLQSLQSTTRTQGSQLQQMQQQTQPPPAGSNPSFMNYQNYYPGLAR